MVLAVVLDANVLYPIALTDFFLTLAGYGLFRPHWSGEILNEVERNLLRNHPVLAAPQLRYRFTQMNLAFPGARVADVVERLQRDLPLAIARLLPALGEHRQAV